MLCAGLVRALYVRYFWQGNHHTYGHVRYIYIYMVLANPGHVLICTSVPCAHQTYTHTHTYAHTYTYTHPHTHTHIHTQTHTTSGEALCLIPYFLLRWRRRKIKAQQVCVCLCVCACLCICRVGQNRISAPYMTVCMVIPLLEIPYVHCTLYILINVWFWPTQCI